MNKKQHLKTDLDPFKVFIEMKRQKKTGRYYARKFSRSDVAVTYAFQGKSKSLLRRIAKDLGIPL